MSILDDLKTDIAATLGRVPTDFVIGGSDLLVLAINNAKRWAQAQRDFDACRTQAKVTVSLSSGAAISAVTLLDGTTACNVKVIECAYMSWNDQTLKPINFLDRKTQSSELRKRLKGWPFRQTLDSPPIDFSNSLGIEDTPNLYQQGTSLYLWPQTNAAFGSSTSIVVTLDVVQYLPDYTSSNVAVVSGTSNGWDGNYPIQGAQNGQSLYINFSAQSALWWKTNLWHLSALSDVNGTPTNYYSYASTPTNESPLVYPDSVDGSYFPTGSPTGFAVVSSAQSNAGNDWFLTHGYEFLKWRAIVEGNYLWEKFAQAQEGMLVSPVDKMKEAWDNLCFLDGGLIGQNTTSFDLD
jgi:hypothetical protein